MSAPLTFRSRTGSVWFTIVFGAAAVAFFNWLHAPPVTLLEGVDNAPSWRLLVLIGYVMIVAMAVAASRRRVVVDEAGLTRHWLLWTRRIAWDEIREVALPRWGRFWWKGVALELDRPTRGFWTLRPGPPTKELVLDGLRDFEGLVREIVARAPQATVSDGVRAYLAAPREVLWRHRLPALLSLGTLAGIVAVAMARTMANGWPGMGLVFAAIAAGPGLPLLCGWALNREWPWKGALLAATAVLFYCLQPALLPALMFGMAAPLLLTLAVCLGWTVATFVVCLPCRPRWPLVVVGYALALAAAVLPTWRYVTDEVLPFGETVPLDGTAMWTAWAPDGSALCVSAWTGEGEEGLCHVVLPLVVPGVLDAVAGSRPLPRHRRGRAGGSHVRALGGGYSERGGDSCPGRAGDIAPARGSCVACRAHPGRPGGAEGRAGGPSRPDGRPVGAAARAGGRPGTHRLRALPRRRRAGARRRPPRRVEGRQPTPDGHLLGLLGG